MTESGDDADLLARSAGGDNRAFEAFVTRHEAWLYRYAHALSAEAAEDVLQETFISAWRAAGGFDGDGSARAWLAAIARNASYRRFRRRAGEPAEHEPLDVLALRAGWGADDLDAAVERARSRKVVGRALARLSAEEHEAVVLRDIEGFTAEEAAAAAGITVAAHKSRLHRGRLRLAACLRESDHG